MWNTALISEGTAKGRPAPHLAAALAVLAGNAPLWAGPSWTVCSPPGVSAPTRWALGGRGGGSWSRAVNCDAKTNNTRSRLGATKVTPAPASASLGCGHVALKSWGR